MIPHEERVYFHRANQGPWREIPPVSPTSPVAAGLAEPEDVWHDGHGNYYRFERREPWRREP